MKLVFLISQPRSGSTMLQAVLARHPEVFAPSEPWLMLPLAYMLRGDEPGVCMPYGAHVCSVATADFFENCLPGGESAFKEVIRDAALRVYETAIQQTSKTVFLDKTPRYYFIIDELLEIFPEARFIFLVRNPLAVLASVIETWRGSYPSDLKAFEADLLRAPRLMLNGMHAAGSRGMLVRYEEFVADPEGGARRLCDFLALSRMPGMSNYGRFERRKYGDPKNVYESDRPHTNSAEKWLKLTSGDPVHWRLSNDYLNVLGRTLVTDLGYNFDELSATLKSHRPRRVTLAPSFAEALKPPGGQAVRRMRDCRCRVARSGFWSTVCQLLPEIARRIGKKIVRDRIGPSDQLLTTAESSVSRTAARPGP